ncbi:MAG: carbohydrate kinase family protein [Mangrovibacterium sp.]|nr:carbohydrate kinase family protein [Mangrovibacterium sp.]
MKKYDAVIAGYLCVDMIPGFPNNRHETGVPALLQPGKLIEIDGLDFLMGGVVANTGMAMKKFGRQVFLNGLTGDDLLGKIVRDYFQKYDLLDGMQVTSEVGTAFSIVLAPPGIDRIFLESPGCNQLLDADFIDFEAVAQSRLFHFGYPPLLRKFYLNKGEQLSAMLSAIKRAGTVTSMDFSLPDGESESGRQDWPAVMEQVLPYTDIFVPSLEEALRTMIPERYERMVSESGDADLIDRIPMDLIRETGRRIIDCGVKVLVIKAAHRGIYLLTGDISGLKERGLQMDKNDWNFRERWCNAYPADPARVKDATGAGDTAVAAFLSALLDGSTPETALKFAALAGRNNLYCRDLYEELDDWQTMEREIDQVPVEVIHLK